MSKYKFNRGWKRWNTNDVIDEYEWKRLPNEIKNICPKIESTPVVIGKIQVEPPSFRSIEIPPVEPTDVKFKPVEDDTKQKKNTKY